MKSPLPLSDARFDLTLFSGYYDTLPTRELRGVSWGEVVDAIAPGESPLLHDEKERAPYFVPCALQDAPFTGKTAEKAQLKGLGAVGKQRSAAHVTPSQILKFDFDDIAKEALKSILSGLRDAGVTFLFYTTHSHGRTPGALRVRLVLPLDRPLAQDDYSTAWAGVAALFFSDVPPGVLDLSAGRIHQQQGVWCTHPDRAEKSRKGAFNGGLISADAAIKAAPMQVPAKPVALKNDDLIAGTGAAAALLETPKNVKLVRGMLATIPCNERGHHSLWRGCVWAVAALRWTCGAQGGAV